MPRSDLLKMADPDVVVDVMSCDPHTAEPALSVILEAFEHGAHVVTANKTPLARFWSDIRGAANAPASGSATRPPRGPPFRRSL